jgi:hypothetical protein
VLRENLLAVRRDVEDAPATPNQLDLGLGMHGSNLRLQTGGAWQVVSSTAVVDGDLQARLLVAFLLCASP